MIKRKDFLHADDSPVRPSIMPPTRPHGQAALLILTALAFFAFWIGVRLHVPRLVPAQPNLGPVVTARFFEMGQGSSLLLIAPEGRAVLIDAGTTLTEETALKASLQQAGVSALSAVIVTSCRAQSIGGLPRLLSVVPVRGPILIPIPRDQFQAQGGRAAEFCLDAVARRSLACVPCQDYLDAHPGLLSATSSLTYHVIPGNPAEASMIRFQYGRSTLVYLGNVTHSEEENALALRGVLACDTLVIPAGNDGSAVAPELLALSSAQDIVVPLPKGTEPNPTTLSSLAASDARLLLTNQAEPIVLGLAAPSDAALLVETKSPAGR